MIHRIHGRTLTDALQRAREEYGDGAVVVGQESLPTGEVTISVSDPRGVIKRTAAAEDPGLADLRERLGRHGASRGLIEHALRAVKGSGVRGAYAVDAAARALGRAFEVQASPKRTGVTRILALVGPSGAGKTTTIAKIGRKLAEGGRGVLFASLDGLGVGELERLTRSRIGADVDRHEIPIHALGGTDEIDEERAIEMGLDVILLDTPGVAVRDAAGMAALTAEIGRLGAHAAVEVHLVLPATHDGAALELALKAYEPILRAVGPNRHAAAILTKLDETPIPGAALERCRRARLPISFLCDGPDARTGLRRARADHFADLELRGRMAG
jgi:flagellar biosynthesis GTPase FlhF